ncbi:GDSL-type esterase/lipase family protein [Streptomyces sp. NPDC127100]|uniref:GDSL-type esterase/lipase family protein n=1 Tax=Streptomyces sp. NPDC127100 TaxID=3347138 RepID=UPI00364E70DA
MRRRAVLAAAAGSLAAAATVPEGRASAAARTVGPVLDHRVERTYDGTSGTDLSSRVAAVRGLSTGTVLATCRTTSRNLAMTLFSASNPAEPSSEIVLGLAAGALQFVVRDKGVVKVNRLTRTMYDDGAWHTFAVTVSGDGTVFHADGRPVLTLPSAHFFSAVSGLASVNVGRNVDSTHPGGEWFYTGGIRRVAVYDRVLTEAELRAESVRVDLADFGTISGILNSDTPANWVITGDSITHGALWTNGWRSYAEHFQERVRWELGKPKNSDFVIDTGVSGSTTNDLVAAFSQRVTAFSPRVVSVMLGTNDVATSGIGQAAYRANLVRLVAAVRALPGGVVPMLQTPNPVDLARWPNRTALGDYADTMRGVAQEQGVVLIDHHAHWLASNGGSVPTGLLGDGLHPDQRGHLFVSHKMIEDLRIFDPGSRVCSLTIP